MTGPDPEAFCTSGKLPGLQWLVTPYSLQTPGVARRALPSISSLLALQTHEKIKIDAGQMRVLLVRIADAPVCNFA